jgi:hypothetical protein
MQRLLGSDLGPRVLTWRSLLLSRTIVLAGGVSGLLLVGRKPGTQALDPPSLTAPFGAVGNMLAAPFARWDSVWYLAHGGYADEPARTAFFPLYPLVVHAVGFVVRSDLLAGILISLVAFGVALWLRDRRVAVAAFATSVLLLGFFTAQFATWRFVS